MKDYQKFLDEKILEISKEKIVLDIGGGERFQKWLDPYKDLFRNCEYKTMDYDARTGADVVGDIHDIPLKEGAVDAVICSSVLEHIKDPIRAVLEIKRVLKPGGKVFVYVPSIYPYHARKGSYPDYWRFFDDTLYFLFEGFSKVEVVKRGGYFKALFFFVPMQHRLKFILGPLGDFLDLVFQTKKRTTTHGYYVYAIK
ncbi:MAG: hypothetical protein QG585_417 [Patescibacteria group bacterium]|jgi:SAM-dependent methyltransferase|nr:hypothetical protein [Patescibacteria group bacterium]